MRHDFPGFSSVGSLSGSGPVFGARLLLLVLLLVPASAAAHAASAPVTEVDGGAEATNSGATELSLPLVLGAFLALGAGLSIALLGARASRPTLKDQPGSELGSLLFEHAPLPIMLCDHEDRIMAVNDAHCIFTGYDREELIGQPATGYQENPAHAALSNETNDTAFEVGEVWWRKKTGEPLTDRVLRLPWRDERGVMAGYASLSMGGILRNEPDRLSLWQAQHDSLTKLPNSSLFEERLTRALLTCEGIEGRRGALLSIDLDRFTRINDSFGLAVGDKVLMETAVRLAVSVARSDTVARLGADNFGVLVETIDSFADAERMARSMLDRLREVYVVDGQELYLTASIGVVLFPAEKDAATELLRKAESARSLIQYAGGDNVGFFEPEINDRAAQRLSLELALRRALENEEFVLYFQPIVDVTLGTVVTCEALLRWRHPERGMVSPGEFIPVAEDSGLIIPIGAWVLREAQAQLKRWRDAGLQVGVSLNLSVRQLRHTHEMQAILEQLATGGATGLTLEVTESAVAENREAMQAFIQSARVMGASVALDDFGTGYSSLGYLRDFRFDVLKVDKCFVDHLIGSHTDLGLVASIISMGRILGMRVVVEGVETEEQIDHLVQIGCDFVQGFYFSKPLPAEDIPAFVRGFDNAAAAIAAAGDDPPVDNQAAV